jgi:myb proto-oncogene protein
LDLDINRGTWAAEEDTRLTNAVKEHGVNNWAAVAALVPGRTNVQCRYRWVNILDPNNNINTNNSTGKWTVEEDAKLAEAVTEFGNDWIRVATLVPGRTNGQCCQRWAQSLDPNNNNNSTGKLTVEEDAKLTEAVAEFGNNWIRVATLVPGRKNVQCRRRWVNSLDPNKNNSNNNTSRWIVKEDAKLAEAVTEFGNDWIRVATLVPGRTNGQCRQRWVNILDPNNKNNNTSKLTVEEDAKLAEAVAEFGNNWIRVATLIPGRMNLQCRRRWVNSLDPNNIKELLI